MQMVKNLVSAESVAAEEMIDADACSPQRNYADEEIDDITF